MNLDGTAKNLGDAPTACYGRLWACVCAATLLSVGCQTTAPTRRPVDDLFQETVTFASARDKRESREAALNETADQSALAVSSATPRRFPTRQAAFEFGGDDSLIGLPEGGVSRLDLIYPPNPLRGAVVDDSPRRAQPQDLGGSAYRDSPPVNEIFEETDIRQALQALATQANASVIVDEQVGGTATAIIEDEPFEMALQKILLPLGYIWEKRGKQYFIGTTDPQSSLYRYLTQRQDYHPKHFASHELLGLLPEEMKRHVRLLEKRNVMVIDAPRSIGEEILAELKHADQPVPQVALEAIVAVFSPELTNQYGINLTQIAQNRGVQLDLSSLALSGTVSPTGVGYLFNKFANTSYFLRLLEQEGYVNIRAAPHVMAKDGEKAQISIARETFFSTQPTTNTEFFFRQEIEKVEAGISLDIIPVIQGDNITVTIERAEVSEDIRETGADPELASPYPLINRRTISTTVSVKDGETIVIGGLTQNQVVDRVNRVPFFSKIPLFGHLFKQIDKQQQEAEVVVYISPRIVYPSTNPGSMEDLPTPIAQE